MCVCMGWRIKNPNDVWLCRERERERERETRVRVLVIFDIVEVSKERENGESLFCSVVFPCLFGVLKTLFLIKGFPLSLSLSLILSHCH